MRKTDETKIHKWNTMVKRVTFMQFRFFCVTFFTGTSGKQAITEKSYVKQLFILLRSLPIQACLTFLGYTFGNQHSCARYCISKRLQSLWNTQFPRTYPTLLLFRQEDPTIFFGMFNHGYQAAAGTGNYFVFHTINSNDSFRLESGCHTK